MSEADRLAVYDKLREAHSAIKDIYCEGLLDRLDDRDRSAIDGIDGVLYTAESFFVRND